MHESRLKALGRPFSKEDLAFKPISVSKDSGKARVIPYATNRAIMDRLDLVCGPENWRNEFITGPGGGVLCGLSVRITREDGISEWITKWDGAENTDIQPVKGGLSASMRRAAVQWGIGRYLYRIPPVHASVDQKGRLTERPVLPEAYLPQVAKPRPLLPRGTRRARNGEVVPEAA